MSRGDFNLCRLGSRPAKHVEFYKIQYMSASSSRREVTNCPRCTVDHLHAPLVVRSDRTFQVEGTTKRCDWSRSQIRNGICCAGDSFLAVWLGVWCSMAGILQKLVQINLDMLQPNWKMIEVRFIKAIPRS